MAGHSKWHNIKNRKAAVDSKKGKLFGHLARQIRIVVKENGSGDPKSNINLRLLLEKAREANMPNVKVQKAIDCGLGKGKTGVIREMVYEGFGPGGVGMIVVALTDNPNRTIGEIKNIVSKGGGNLGAPGCAMYMFKRSADGGFITTMPFVLEDSQAKADLKCLIENLRENEDVEDVYTTVELED